MGGVFLVWFIPVALVFGLALVIFYFCIRRTWPAQDEKKSGVQMALEQDPPEPRATQDAGRADSPPDRPA